MLPAAPDGRIQSNSGHPDPCWSNRALEAGRTEHVCSTMMSQCDPILELRKLPAGCVSDIHHLAAAAPGPRRVYGASTCRSRRIYRRAGDERFECQLVKA